MIKAFIQGNLTNDVELKTVNEKQVATFTVASNRPGKEGADYLRVEVWGTGAKNCAKYLKKGCGVCCAGDLSIDNYTKDNAWHVALKLTNAQVEFTDRKPIDAVEPKATADKTETKSKSKAKANPAE